MTARHIGQTLYQRRALIAASVATLVCLIAWQLDPTALAAAWLGAWLFFVGIAVGALVIVMIHELTGGAWGFAIRRPLEAAMMTLPVLAALALPLAFNLPNLYPWAHATAGKDAEILLRKAAYLNVAFFGARTVIYFTVWIALAFALRRHWLRRETNAGDTPNGRLRALSIAGLVLYAITATLAAVDWVMSLSAAWYSTAFGLLAMVSQAYSAFAFATACAVWAGDVRAATDHEGHTAGDLGNIVLTFAMLWAYLAFTQFLIIWAEDLPNEIDWYVARSSAFWKALAIAVLALKFVVPFAAMLLRSFKREPRRLAGLCAALLIGQGLEIVWMIEPSLASTRLWTFAADVAGFVAVGGFWIAAFLRLYPASPTLRAPARSPPGVPQRG